MAGATLKIDLGRVIWNWRYFVRACEKSGRPCNVGAVVKADAYGLGAAPVARALYGAGCSQFFVAHGFEGALLRDEVGDAPIFVFHGALAGEEELFLTHKLTPVLNNLEALQCWTDFARKTGYSSAALQVDTGMKRLGFSGDEFRRICMEGELTEELDLRLIMSHLACADDPTHDMNLAQTRLFDELMALRSGSLAEVPLSLANSGGCLLGADFQYDICRVGIGLYGGNPFQGTSNPLRDVVCLEAEILQINDVAVGESVSYGADWCATKPSRIATLGVGYADGYLRSFGERGFVTIGHYEAPVVGRVTMDLMMVDVSDIPAGEIQPGDMVALIDGQQRIDEVASRAQTISYEVLTCLGRRYERTYIGGDDEA